MTEGAADTSTPTPPSTEPSFIQRMRLDIHKTLHGFFRFFIIPVFFFSAALSILIVMAYFFLPVADYRFDQDGNLSTYAKVYSYVRQFSRPAQESQMSTIATDAPSQWLRSCFSQDQKNGPNALGSLVWMQGTRIGGEIREVRDALAELRARSYFFLTLAAVVGFLTTIVAALNTWQQVSGKLAVVLKLFGVMLPALGTLVAALFSVYAPVDTAARKAQLLSSLIGLEGDLNAILASAKCTDMQSEKAELTGSISDWNKRFAAALAAAEFSQSASSVVGKDKPDPNATPANETVAPTTN